MHRRKRKCVNHSRFPVKKINEDNPEEMKREEEETKKQIPCESKKAIKLHILLRDALYSKHGKGEALDHYFVAAVSSTDIRKLIDERLI